MKILIVSYMVPNSRTGVSIHYMNLTAQLRNHGHNVDLITSESIPKLIHYPLYIFIWFISLFGKLGQQVASQTNYFLRIYIATYLKRNIKYDIINAQDVGSGLASKLVFKHKAPVIVTCHFNDNPATELIARRNLSGAAASFIKKLFKYQFSKINYFNGVSDYVLQKASALIPNDAVTETIYNSVDFNQIASIPFSHDFKEKYKNRKIIMNVGYLEKRKNQKFIIELANIIKHTQKEILFILVGDGEDKDVLKSMIVNNQLENYVIMIGHQKEVISFLKCADLYLHTALNENCPLIILEAIAAKIPVMAFAVGGIPEIVQTKSALLEINSNKEYIATELLNIMNNYSVINGLGNSQYSYAINHFDVTIMIERYVGFYNKVINDFKQRRT